MKKSVKIIGIILAVPVLAAIIIFIFFPGLAVYVEIKKDFEYTDMTAEKYPYQSVDIPSEWNSLRRGDTMVYAPSNLAASNARTDFYISPEKDVAVIFLDENDCSSFSLHEQGVDNDVSDKQLNDFCAEIGFDAPDSEYDFYNILYSLNMDNFEIGNKENAVSFLIFATLKETLLPTFKRVYYYSTPGAVGFIEVLDEPDEETDKYKWVLHLYDEETLTTCYNVMIMTSDLETMKQIVSSLTLIR